MPNPTPNMVHVNRPLTNISVAFQQSQSDYIADKVFSRIPVQKKSDDYFVYDKGDWFRTDADIRPPSTESAGGGYNVTTDTYTAKRYAVHKDVDIELRENADNPLDPDREATLFVTNQLLLKREKLWASTFFTTSVWDTDQTGVAAAPGANQFLQWNEAASDPITDVANYQIAMKQLTGRKPNVLTIGPHVFTALRNNASIIDRIKYTQRGVVTLDLLASLFEVSRVVVAEAVENTANEGQADAMDFIFGKGALLTHAAPSPGLMTPSAGYIFVWNKLIRNAFGSSITRFPMRNITSDRVEGEMAFDMKVVAPELGKYLDQAVA